MSKKLSVGAVALLAGLAVPTTSAAQVSGFSFGVGGLFDGVSFGLGVSAYGGYSDGYYDDGYYDDGYYGDPYAPSSWCSYGPVPPYGYNSGFFYSPSGYVPFWGPGVLNSGWYNDCILGGSPHAYHAFHAQLLFWQHRNSWRQRWYQAIRVRPLWDPWDPFFGYNPWGPGYYGATSVVVVNNNARNGYGWSGQRYVSPFYRGTDYKEAARDRAGQSAIPRGRAVASPAPRTGADAPSNPGDIRTRSAPTSMTRPERGTAAGSPATRRATPTSVPTRATTRTGSPGASRSAPATVRIRPSDAAREGSSTIGRARPTVTRAAPPERPAAARRPTSLLRGDDRPETRRPERGSAAPTRPTLGVRGSRAAPTRPSSAAPTRPSATTRTRPTQRTGNPTETRRRPVIRPPTGGAPATAGPTRRPTSGNPVIRRPPTTRPTQRSGGSSRPVTRSKPVIRSTPVKRTGGGGSQVKRPPARSGGGGPATTARKPTVRKRAGGGA